MMKSLGIGRGGSGGMGWEVGGRRQGGLKNVQEGGEEEGEWEAQGK